MSGCDCGHCLQCRREQQDQAARACQAQQGQMNIGQMQAAQASMAASASRAAQFAPMPAVISTTNAAPASPESPLPKGGTLLGQIPPRWPHRGEVSFDMTAAEAIRSLERRAELLRCGITDVEKMKAELATIEAMLAAVTP